MKYTRQYTGSDGETHFEEVEVPLKPVTGRVAGRRVSEPIKVKSIYFSEDSVAFEVKGAKAPHRQFVIPLEGEVEVVAGDGTSRTFGPGSIHLAEDTTGRGHTTRVITPHRLTLFVTLD